MSAVTSPTYGSIDLPDCWGIDAAMAGVFTDAELVALSKARLANGQLIKFIWGYVPLPNNPKSSWDMSAERARAICDLGFCLLLVQHCRSGYWIASKTTGTEDGAFAGNYAKSIGYPSDAHLALDDESLKDQGTPVFQHVVGWCGPGGVQIGARPVVYEGFDPGLSPTQLYEVPDVNRYWGAYGPWDVSTRSVCCRQSLQTTVAGLAADPDHAFPDKLGGVLRAMCRPDLAPARLALT
jgi:hypothetical protein